MSSSLSSGITFPCPTPPVQVSSRTSPSTTLCTASFSAPTYAPHTSLEAPPRYQMPHPPAAPLPWPTGLCRPPSRRETERLSFPLSSAQTQPCSQDGVRGLPYASTPPLLLFDFFFFLVIFFFFHFFVWWGLFVKDYFIYKYKYISNKKKPEAWSRGWNH